MRTELVKSLRTQGITAQQDPNRPTFYRCIFQGAQPSDAAAAITTALQLQENSPLRVLQVDGEIAILDGTELEEGLTQWLNDPEAWGNKKEAARAIRQAFYSNSEELNLSELRLSSLPEAIGQLSALQTLLLYENNLSSLPEAIGQLTALQDLYLSNNNLSSIPEVIGQLTALKVLNLSENNLSSLPEAIGLLTALKVLDLSENNLSSIPEAIGLLTALEALHLSHNNLSSIPEAIGRLTALEALRLFKNNLSSIPEAIGLLTALKVLDLSKNNLSSIPEAIGLLTALEALHLSHNNLSSIPEAIGLLTALEKLHLSHNPALNSLPLSMQALTNLTHLICDRTSIEPAQIASLWAVWRAARDRTAVARLPALFELWKQYAHMPAADLSFASQLDTPAKQAIAEFLLRLTKTADFGADTQTLAETVCSMLEDLGTEGWKHGWTDIFLTQVGVNNEACGDRGAMAFNELYTAWLCQKPMTGTAAEKLRLLCGLAKTLTLRKELAKLIKGQNTGESVEVYLYYELTTYQHSSVDIKPTTFAKRMLYHSIGKRAWVDPEVLHDTIEETYFDSLDDMPAFQEILKQNARVGSAWQRLKTQSQDEVAELDTQSDFFDDEINAIATKRRQEQKELLMQLTLTA